MSRELLQQALDALKVSAWDHIHAVGKQALIDAIIDRLAQPDAEPVAEVIDREHQPWEHGKHTSWLVNPSDLPAGTKLYAAALNARVTVPREPTQEMIAAGEAVFRSYCFRHVNGAIPTYEAMIAAAPAPAVPLTDEQFADIVAEASLAVDLAANPLKLLAFARAVLKAHGIGGGGK